ncbi:MAG TPA: hypothetical protein VMH77_02925 [Steroidobacteraceae bacterium]|nr:hypothetical protein [Steroidobacteraceae bacterium]
MKCLLLGCAVLLLGCAAAQAAPDPAQLRTSTRYDQEYPVIGYSTAATHNRVWRLQQRLESGQTRLAWDPKFGFLPALLQELDIDPDSQVLVFSRTSLQFDHISEHKPRAVYFNDDTYIGYVQDSTLVEVATIDSEKGAVFYAFQNRQDDTVTHMEREGGRCLTCHDTYSMMGGGVPRLMVLSSPVDDAADTRTYTSGDETDDRTPLAERWGGWYVTGNTGTQTHFGNLPLRDEVSGEKLRELAGRRLNIGSVKQYVDASSWLTDKSDVVALLVLEHQTSVEDLITRANYKVRTVMARAGDAVVAAPRSWEDITPGDRKRLGQMIEPLVRALFFQDAAPYGHRIESSNDFATRFSQQGPRDSRGRSLYQLDLNTRLLRYPLSYQIYSAQFDALPQYALDYIYSRIVEILQGRDKTGISASIAPEDRKAITGILIDTKPALAALLRPVAAHQPG